MRLKNALKFRYKKNSKLIGVFYIALAAIVLFALVIKKLYPHGLGTFKDGVDILYYLTAILSFIVGVLSFKDEQKFFVQNGITREQCHKSFIGYLPIAIGFALAERIFTFLFCTVIKVDYSHFLSTRVAVGDRPFIVDVLYEAIALMCFLSFGYLISIIIHKIKPIYIILAIILIVVALFADYSLSQVYGLLPIFAYVPRLIYFGSAFNELIPLNFVVSHILTICILLSLAHILSLNMHVNGKEKH